MISAALLGCHQEEIFGNGNRPKQQCFFFGQVSLWLWYGTIPYRCLSVLRLEEDTNQNAIFFRSTRLTGGMVLVETIKKNSLTIFALQVVPLRA